MSRTALSHRTSISTLLINELQFLLHFAVIFGGLALSWFLHPLIVLAIGVVQKAHLRVFKGCVLTNIHKLTGGIDIGKGFWQTVFKRFFNKNITKKTARTIDYGWTILMLVVSLAGYIVRSR